MADLKARLKPIFRRSSTTSSAKSSTSGHSTSILPDPPDTEHSRAKNSLRLGKNRIVPVYEEREILPKVPPLTPLSPPSPSKHERRESSAEGTPSDTPDAKLESPRPEPLESVNPTVTIERPTPELRGRSNGSVEAVKKHSVEDFGKLGEPSAQANNTTRPSIAVRRRSPIPESHTPLFDTLQGTEHPQTRSAHSDHLTGPPIRNNMSQRKIWVKRSGSSATLVLINEDDLVDDVRGMILKKYANSLGRNFDPPDVTLRVIRRKQSARHSHFEQMLGPEEVMSKVLDVYFPGGQAVDEALIIDVPQRRTPKHSPRLAVPYYMADTLRPGENGTDYFPPMPTVAQSSPHLPSNLSASSGQTGNLHRPNVHSISVIENGLLPDLPSPGSRVTRHSHRPKYPRTHTSSPTVISGPQLPQTRDLKVQNPQPLPTPPLPIDAQPHRVATPPPRISSPRPRPSKRNKKPAESTSSTGLLDGAIPPINVLVVEDNHINMKVLEALLKRLKVRWSAAVNGLDAVTKWREGGFHLVLMDIQLPIMSGLEATREIRRLEMVNHIGVFSNSASSTPTLPSGGEIMNEPAAEGKDSLMNTALFKSPVIIVALTASSLQSDRHEALAAGCNDFLTKPVNFDWLSRKVMEWGCMQALIDFDGWRKWKDLSQTKPGADSSQKTFTLTNAKSPLANGKTMKRPPPFGGAGDSAASDGTDTNGDTGSGTDAAVIEVA